MTSKELVTAAIAGQPVARIPTGPLAVHACAGMAGFTVREYSTNGAALAESVLRYYDRFRPDALWISADTWVSAEAMGARVSSLDPHQPLGGVGDPVVRTAADIDRIPGPDVGSQGRYPVLIEALGRVVEALGREVFIVACFDQYPFSLASALMGLDEIMMRVEDDPPFVHALMRRCEEYILAYSRALAQAGADMLSGGDSPAGLLGPGRYAAVALPAEQRVIASLRSYTDKPISLHICGDTRLILPLMASSGAHVFELDHAVGMTEACRLLGGGSVLWGNLDPVGVLHQGTPATVTKAVQSLLQGISAAGHRRFVLSSGCTLAPGTPMANLQALLNVQWPAGG
jgi:uroporphyrinogen decarboxylase